jgi:DNA-binding response OmpR family regulator
VHGFVFERKSIICPDKRILYFTPTQVAIVKVLMMRHGRSVSKSDIADLVWGRQIGWNLINVNLHRIRKYIDGLSPAPFRIGTLHGIGFRLFLPKDVV